MGDYRKLRSWQKAHELVLAVYRATEHYPAEERYGLVRQMRRAAISTACNLAKRVGRHRRRETAQFVRIALGSCTELEYQVHLSQEPGYMDEGSPPTSSPEPAISAPCSPPCVLDSSQPESRHQIADSR